MAFGKMAPVKDTRGNPILTINGAARMGGGWEYETRLPLILPCFKNNP